MAGRANGKVSMLAGTVWPSGRTPQLSLCVSLQRHAAAHGRHIAKQGRDDLGIFSTQTPLMILVFIKCSKSSRPSFSSSWPRKPGRQSCVEGCPCCRAPVRVKNRCLQSCEGCSSEIEKMAGRVHGKVSMLAGTVWPSGLRRWLQAPVRKGVGSNPTAVTLCVFGETCSRTWPAHCKARGGMI